MAGLGDRGMLREGGPADLVVYDPATIRRTPAWDQAERTLRLAGRRLAVDAAGRRASTTRW